LTRIKLVRKSKYQHWGFAAKASYAKGEITEDEFEEMKKHLR
jgi:uncharacterized membrane protein